MGEWSAELLKYRRRCEVPTAGRGCLPAPLAAPRPCRQGGASEAQAAACQQLRGLEPAEAAGVLCWLIDEVASGGWGGGAAGWHRDEHLGWRSQRDAARSVVDGRSNCTALPRPPPQALTPGTGARWGCGWRSFPPLPLAPPSAATSARGRAHGRRHGGAPYRWQRPMTRRERFWPPSLREQTFPFLSPLTDGAWRPSCDRPTAGLSALLF